MTENGCDVIEKKIQQKIDHNYKQKKVLWSNRGMCVLHNRIFDDAVFGSACLALQILRRNVTACHDVWSHMANMYKKSKARAKIDLTRTRDIRTR